MNADPRSNPHELHLSRLYEEALQALWDRMHAAAEVDRTAANLDRSRRLPPRFPGAEHGPHQ